ncbi:MAG TPA: penicillin acylase family protein, partial [Terriglobales bacterium]|nr:penicillin acylase family protein [Terriglobales bacterium]
MSSGTLSLTRIRPGRRWRALAWLLPILIVAAVGAIVWLYAIARSPLPELDGTISVSGISGPVSVIRDNHGVPTIEAATLDNLFFAQGYVTAQDRLFQMDLFRRAASGELSDIVGNVTLKQDRQQRILGLRAAAEKNASIATAEDRAQFDAYARGVNAYIDSHRDRLPLEFRLLH